jgi:hypothetical protein
MAILGQSIGKSDEWYTPHYIFDALGCIFDLDVASPGAKIVPWIPAREHITEASLSKRWIGFIWMNPPFGGQNGLEPWLDKFFAHGNGIALVPDRTSASWWQKYVPRADLVLFIAQRIKFIDKNLYAGQSPALGTCLLSIGESGNVALQTAHKLGTLMTPVRTNGLASKSAIECVKCNKGYHLAFPADGSGKLWSWVCCKSESYHVPPPMNARPLGAPEKKPKPAPRGFFDLDNA